MKKNIIGLILICVISVLQAKEVNSDQVKVAYTYNFLKHTIWKNESNLKEYHLLVVSKNESLKNMFMMLSSRKSLNDKKIRISFYDPRINPQNVQAIYVDEASTSLYDKLFYAYEPDDVLFISDGYKDRKKVMINLTENGNIIAFEINKANILNRGLNVSPDLVLLGGTEIDVARLYKSSQDELKEQKESIISLNKKIAEKNSELNAKIAAIEKQKDALTQQQTKIDQQNMTIVNQSRSITEQEKMLQTQQSELESIRSRIEAQKHQFNEKELILKTLLESHQDKQQEINQANEVLKTLNDEINKQKNNLIHQEDVISSQQVAIGVLLLLSLIIVILSVFIFKQNRRLNELSLVDPLTGLYNRRAFTPKIRSEIDQFERYGTQLSILIIDIDHFKSINDTYGHDVGDKVLKEIANLIRDYVRKTDFCVRWGGEEFVVLATSTQQDKAMIMAQNLRVAIENHPFQIDKKVTISIGLTSFQEGEQLESFIRKADEALYKAKQNGRNQIIIG